MSAGKPPKTYREQIQILRDRGLEVPNPQAAEDCLAHHNYYRLSAYRFPLAIPGDPDRFQSGTRFDDLWELYHFDRALRQLVAEAVERIEVSVRSRWAYVLGHAHGSQAYEEPSVFRNAQRHTNALARLDEELNRSDEIFVTHYRQKYNMSRPPIWAACEVMSFGLLSRFYANIKREGDRKVMARTYGVSADQLKSLLEHCVYIRNLCAHHSRLWNRRFTITVQLPRTTPAPVIPNLNPAEPRRLYNTLVLLVHMLQVIEPAAHWPDRLTAQLLSLDSKYHPQIGCPNNWQNLPLWKGLMPAA